MSYEVHPCKSKKLLLATCTTFLNSHSCSKLHPGKTNFPNGKHCILPYFSCSFWNKIKNIYHLMFCRAQPDKTAEPWTVGASLYTILKRDTVWTLIVIKFLKQYRFSDT